ncbi:MAG TPA: GatB/YqeY domain-containing protein [Terriglobia bacterium]|nr:GatB/YqeY domain-containing protein [Terriglobia bacterium]
MSLVEQVEKDLVAAMKAQETLRLSVLRMMKTALKLKQVESGQALPDEEARAVLRTLVKQRRDSVEAFSGAGRVDLAEKELAEMKILEGYLPAAATEDDLDAAVSAGIAETGAVSVKDLGKVMKAAMSKLSGKTVDGKRLSEKVRAKLGA